MAERDEWMGTSMCFCLLIAWRDGDGWIELACRGVAGIDLRACESLGNYCQMIRFSKIHLIRFSFSKQVLCNTMICFLFELHLSKSKFHLCFIS